MMAIFKYAVLAISLASISVGGIQLTADSVQEAKDGVVDIRVPTKMLIDHGHKFLLISQNIDGKSADAMYSAAKNVAVALTRGMPCATVGDDVKGAQETVAMIGGAVPVFVGEII